MKQNPIKNNSFAFALRVVKLAKFLDVSQREFVLSRQVLRSGTSIGALVREAEHAEKKSYSSIESDGEEIVKMLTAIVKTSKTSKLFG